MSEERKQIYEVIGDYVQANPDWSDRKIARQIIEDGLDCGLSDRAIRYRISDFRDKDGDIIVTETDYQKKLQEKFKNPLEIVNGIAYIKTKFATVSMPMSKIDKMHYQYSEMGENQTELDIMTNFRLKPWEWNAIKNAFMLRKKSNIYSDFTLHNMEAADVEPLIESKIDEMLNSKKVAKKMYDKAILRKYKDTLKQHNFAVVENLAFMSEIANSIHVFERPVYFPPVEIIPSRESLTVLADLHIGAEYEGGSRTPKIDSRVIDARLFEVAKITNSYDSYANDILILGDLIETFSGLNHPNSWQGIEKGMYGANVTIAAYNTIRKLCENVRSFRTLYLNPGNHDRSSSSNKEDVRGEIAYIIAAFLEEAFPGRVVNLGDVGSFQHSDINFIATHGHLGLSSQSAAAMSFKYGKQGMFNMILMGHLHSRILKNHDDGLDFRKMICPSIFSGNKYSDQLGFDGGAGFLRIERGPTGKPIVTDFTL